MPKFWSVNLMAHRQPLKCDNHDKYVLNTVWCRMRRKKKSIAVLATVTAMRKYVGQMQPRSAETQKELTRSAGLRAGLLLDASWWCCHKADWMKTENNTGLLCLHAVKPLAPGWPLAQVLPRTTLAKAEREIKLQLCVLNIKTSHLHRKKEMFSVPRQRNQQSKREVPLVGCYKGTKIYVCVSEKSYM